jgi:hypothetical protein
MDVKDVQSQFGSKYDSGIKQAQDYTKTIPQEQLQPTSAPSADIGQ